MSTVLDPTEPAPTQTSRQYRDNAHPLWRRWLFSREVAVIALLIVVILYSRENIAFFDRQITMTFLLLDVAPILLIGSDVIGRVIARPGEVQVGIVTALIGAPFFIALVRRRKLAEL